MDFVSQNAFHWASKTGAQHRGANNAPQNLDVAFGASVITNDWGTEGDVDSLRSEIQNERAPSMFLASRRLAYTMLSDLICWSKMWERQRLDYYISLL